MHVSFINPELKVKAQMQGSERNEICLLVNILLKRSGERIPQAANEKKL